MTSPAIAARAQGIGAGYFLAWVTGACRLGGRAGSGAAGHRPGRGLVVARGNATITVQPAAALPGGLGGYPRA